MAPSHTYKTQLLPFWEEWKTNTSKLQLSHLNALNHFFIPVKFTILWLLYYSTAFSVRQLLKIVLGDITLLVCYHTSFCFLRCNRVLTLWIIDSSFRFMCPIFTSPVQNQCALSITVCIPQHLHIAYYLRVVLWSPGNTCSAIRFLHNSIIIKHNGT